MWKNIRMKGRRNRITPMKTAPMQFTFVMVQDGNVRGGAPDWQRGRSSNTHANG
jgi:hypothetical protein